MATAKTQMGSYDRRSIKDSLKFVSWVFVWMVSMTVVDKAHLYGWWESEWITWLGMGIHMLLGLGMIRYYMQMLKRMDDLQRKIQLDGMALALGISLVGCALYMLLVTWGYIVDEEASDIFMLMTLATAFSVMFQAIRYR